MSGNFDIFVRLPEGQLIWIKAVESLEEAERELNLIAAELPGDYFIFNAGNGQVTIPSQSVRSF